jgi:hypothetical protein
MRVKLPHRLTKDEVRERLRDHAHEIAGNVPAQIDTSWADPDHLNLLVNAMGQELTGAISIGEGEITVELDLPFMMSFAEPMIAGAIREKGQALLA